MAHNAMREVEQESRESPDGVPEGVATKSDFANIKVAMAEMKADLIKFILTAVIGAMLVQTAIITLVFAILR